MTNKPMNDSYGIPRGQVDYSNLTGRIDIYNGTNHQTDIGDQGIIWVDQATKESMDQALATALTTYGGHEISSMSVFRSRWSARMIQLADV